MKINVASLITDTQIQSNPTTQLPTGFTGDQATNYTQIKNYILNQIGFAPLFDSSTKGQAIDLNAVNLNDIESAAIPYNTSGLYSVRSNCTNNPLLQDALMLWLRGSTNEQSQTWIGTGGIFYYRRKTGGVWGSWKSIPTNTAAVNELVKSDGTNAVGSGVYNSSTGVYDFGTSLTGSSRTFNATGSATDIGLIFNAKGIGTIAFNSYNPASIVSYDGGTNTIGGLAISHTVTAGTPATGIGTGISLYTPNSSNSVVLGGIIASVATSVTPASESFDIVFKTMVAGVAASEQFRLGSNKIGFFAHSTSAQQSVLTTLVNNVTSGGSTSTIADFTSLTVYATDAATIRNNDYQLAKKLLAIETALRNYGLVIN